MAFDFDQVIERRQTASVKWDLQEFQGVLPMWVADMDFASPDVILDAIHQRVSHGIFGYSLPPDSLTEITVRRLKELYHYEIQPEWIVWLPGLETALTLASMTVGAVDDTCLCFGPIYPPFYTGPRKAQRKIIRLPFLKETSGWEVDWDQLEYHFREDRVRLLLLCNPHNPVGKVFSQWELQKLGSLCLSYGVIFCSDEVHCDLILTEAQHISLASLSAEFCQNTITLMAPSKTFNVAGLGCGFAIISNDKLRQSFRLSMRSITPGVNPLAYAACEAAYRYGEPWRVELIQYLKTNLDVLSDFVRRELSSLEFMPPQASYLAWINCQSLGLKDPCAHFKGFRLGLSSGGPFGDPQSVRLNFGCPRSTLELGCERMLQAVKAL